MLIYLAHAKANYSSEGDGYVMGLRTAEHARTLWSFHFSRGPTLPLNHEDLSRVREGQFCEQQGWEPPGN